MAINDKAPDDPMLLFFFSFTCGAHVLCDARDRGHALFSRRYKLFLHVPEAFLFFRDVHEQYMKSSSSSSLLQLQQF